MRTIVIFLILTTLVYINCSVTTDEISISGDKTMLEEQVLGAFAEIESNTWVIASTRSVGGGQTQTMSAQRQNVLESVQNRKFNKDEIDEFKKEQVLGENNKGYLEILPTEKYESDSQYKRIIDQIVTEENQDRKVIYERILAINPSAAAADDEERNKIFAKLNIDNSPDGTLIQKSDGSWSGK